MGKGKGGSANFFLFFLTLGEKGKEGRRIGNGTTLFFFLSFFDAKNGGKEKEEDGGGERKTCQDGSTQVGRSPDIPVLGRGYFVVAKSPWMGGSGQKHVFGRFLDLFFFLFEKNVMK